MDTRCAAFHNRRMSPLRIRAWRKFRKLTQQQLADACGMTNANLSRIETGAQQYTRDNLLAIAKALQCETFDLIGPFDPGTDEHALVTELRRMSASERTKLVKVLRALREAQAA